MDDNTQEPPRYFIGSNGEFCIGCGYPFYPARSPKQNAESSDVEFSIDDGSSLNGGRKITGEEWLKIRQERQAK